MTAVDRLGFHVRLKTEDGMRGARIAFLREASNPAETRKVLVEMCSRPGASEFQIQSTNTWVPRGYRGNPVCSSYYRTITHSSGGPC